jgi:hypothetical protein
MIGPMTTAGKKAGLSFSSDSDAVLGAKYIELICRCWRVSILYFKKLPLYFSPAL